MKPLSEEEIAHLRAQFPVLSRPGRGLGQNIAYLDWAATSQKPQRVLDAERAFYSESNGAVNRGTHLLADESSLLFEDARESIARFVGAQTDEIVWTKNATEAINVLAYALSNPLMDGQTGWGGREGQHDGALKRNAFDLGANDPVGWQNKSLIGPGDKIVTTRAEHHANLVPWQLLAKRTGAEFDYLDLTPDGQIDLATLSRITANTKIVAFTHVSNVTGALSPVEKIVEKARSVGAWTVLDTCQSSAHMRLDLKALGVDFACLSAHKMCGPTGIGALYGRAELLEQLPPVIAGGSMIADVDMDRVIYQDAPLRFEAGSQPVAQVVSWAQAVKFLEEVGWERIEQRERQLTDYLLAGVAQLPHLRILGSTDPAQRLGLVSFTMDGVHPHDIGQFLDAKDVAIRVGHHCALPLHKFFGVRASARASLSFVNTEQDIDRLVEGLAQTRKFFCLT